MPIPLRSLSRFIHSTYTRTRTRTRKYTRSGSPPPHMHAGSPSTPLARAVRHRIAGRHSSSPQSLKGDRARFFPKYGIWSQTSPRRDTHGAAGGSNTASVPFISRHRFTRGREREREKEEENLAILESLKLGGLVRAARHTQTSPAVCLFGFFLLLLLLCCGAFSSLQHRGQRSSQSARLPLSASEAYSQ